MAWNNFYKGKKGKKDVELFRVDLEDNIFSLHKQLLDNTWKHGNYQEFIVCDPKTRQIHKASVVDRVMHHAIFRILEPIFDNTFIYDSWSCRKNKGIHKSVLRFHKKLEIMNRRSDKVWILKCDIKKFFKSVDQDILIKQVQRKIDDKKFLELLKFIIYSFPAGLPLGNLTSQLFANIYLNQLDHFIKEKLRVKVYLRYSDDFVLVSSSKQDLENNLEAIKFFLDRKLNLVLHNNKISLRPYHWGVDWLGFVLYPQYRILRNKSKKRMYKKIRMSVYNYFKDDINYNKLQSVFASYDGNLKYSWNSEYKKYLCLLKNCI